MAQGKFEIKRARPELGFTPSTAVRANISLDTGEQAIGAAVAGLGGTIVEESARKQAIRLKDRKNLDSLSADQATELRKQRDSDIEIMKGATPPEKWEEEAAKIAAEFNTRISGLDFSPEEAAKQQIKSASD